MGKKHSKPESSTMTNSEAQIPINMSIEKIKIIDPYESLDDENVLNTLQENFKKMELSFKYFLDLKETSDIVQSKRALRSLKFMSSFCIQDNFRESRDQYDLITKYNMIEVFSNITKFCYPYVKQFVSENMFLNDISKKDDINFKNLKIKFLFVSYLTRVLCSLTELSKNFRYKYHDQKGSENLLNYLGDEELINNCLNFKWSISKKEKNVNDSTTGIIFLRLLIACCHNLSKTADTKLDEWREMNATIILLKFASITESYPSIRLYAYLALTNVVNDKEIETLPETITVIRDIIKLIKIGSNSISTKNELKRVKIDIDSDDFLDTEVCIIVYGLNQYNIIELIEAVYKLSINDKTKPLIYQTFEMNIILKTIIIEGNNLEKEYALKLLYQLCFDPSVRNKVFSEDRQLVDYLVEFNKKQHTKEEGFSKKMVKGILWLKKQYFKEPNSSQRRKKSGDSSALNDFIRGLKSPEFVESESNDKSKKRSEINEENNKFSKSQSLPDLRQTGHIMISYNKECRDLCLKIKSQLEKDGHRVWIDVEDISGNSLESMAKAVENSLCVLVCMTEKYKLSPNCRAEAEYSFNLRKPIIPLIMQGNNYVPDGWLGLILGTKIFVNFTKYPFEECILRLKKELKNILPESMTIEQNQNTTEQVSNVENKQQLESKKFINSTKNWKNKDVKKWMAEQNFHVSIQSTLNNFDGELLEQLYLMRQDAPEFFFTTLKQNGDVDLFSIIKFSNELKKIF